MQSIFFCQKNRVGTNKGQSELIRDNWYFLKKISVPYQCAPLYYLELEFLKTPATRFYNTVGGGYYGTPTFHPRMSRNGPLSRNFPYFFKTSKAGFLNRILCRFFSAFQKYKVYFLILILSDVIALFQHVIAPFQRTVLD